MRQKFEEAVALEYECQQTPTDLIVACPVMALWFTDLVNQRPGLPRRYPVEEVCRALLRLRKAGRLPGGRNG